MNGSDLKKLRERRGWSQTELAQVLNTALGRSYGSGSISPWENDRRPIPPDVASFAEELMLSTNLQPAAGEQEPEPDPLNSGTGADGDERPADTAPGPGAATQVAQPPLGSNTDVWGRACTELWELIATGVGMAGAVSGNEAVMIDGQIIAADAPALGAAWAKLAETNETFRKMLIGMTEGGAWLQVAMVTGTTVSKCYQSHALIASAAAREHDGPPEHAAAAA